MSDRSAIEWTDATWNPVTGCTKVSPGCAHCYAETFAERFRGVPGHPYEQGFDLRFWPERLATPLLWDKPRRVFVNSMSALFHEAIPDEYIRRVFDVMATAPQHQFQVLTKRHQRLGQLAGHLPWPENVWMGVSIENDRWVERADVLRQVPASVRFVSAEPLLGPLPHLNLDGLGWLIAGGESGPGRRPAAIDELVLATVVRDARTGEQLYVPAMLPAVLHAVGENRRISVDVVDLSRHPGTNDASRKIVRRGQVLRHRGWHSPLHIRITVAPILCTSWQPDHGHVANLYAS